MPTAIEALHLSRRALLPCLWGMATWSPTARGGPPTDALVAAWQQGPVQRIGVLTPGPQGLRVRQALDVPTRAHGLCPLPDGRLVAVARRPGDWLLAWRPGAPQVQWHWLDADRRYNGHVWAHPNRPWLCTTETDLLSGHSLVGVYERDTLHKRDEWPTHGIDAHELCGWPTASPRSEGHLLVANGGVPTQPETGRVKGPPQAMDASLVRLHALTGQIQGQWRLDDPLLSPRHLAVAGPDEPVAVALQAEHADPTQRHHAPVLALWNGQRLTPCPAPQPLGGYGGSVARHQGGWVVGCPRAGGLAHFDHDGRWRGWTPLTQACALAPCPQGLWAGGQGLALHLDTRHAPRHHPLPAKLVLDNHWQAA